MKTLLFTLTVLIVIGCSKIERIPTDTTPESLSILPVPAKATIYEGVLQLPSQLIITADTEAEQQVASLLKEFLQSRSIDADLQSESDDASIAVSIINDASLGQEGYILNTHEGVVSIKANSGAGLFYGFQSLLQLLTSDNTMPAVSITDHPRFSYRGLHLDVGRHMFSLETIKKYIDLMAHYKFNTFHWHLTEDQGWRIEIKKYPKLTEIGAYRDETVVGHATTATRDEAVYDGIRYGGYYTQEEVKEIVAYAATRYITVIPEIEMPGHAQAALTAYPHLGCTEGPYHVAKTWGVFDEVFCAGKETTFGFLEDVIDEVVELFPSSYIHIGGDECPKTRWKTCSNCQKRIQDEGLADEHELQSYFIQRMEKYINSKGRRIIGWDEILEGGLAPDATVMSWRGEEGGIEAAQLHHDVIMTPVKWCYLDYYQADPDTEPLAIGGLLPVKQVYDYEPLPATLTADQQKHILGAQGNVWTEYITTPEHLEYMVYPRAIALSEVLWSHENYRNYDNFVERMKRHRLLLDTWKVNYAKHIFE